MSDRVRHMIVTLTEQHVFWEIPESRLYHVKVATAHTVHERGQEVCCQAEQKNNNNISILI